MKEHLKTIAMCGIAIVLLAGGMLIGYLSTPSTPEAREFPIELPSESKYLQVYLINASHEYRDLHMALGIHLPVSDSDWEESANALNRDPYLMETKHYIDHIINGPNSIYILPTQ